jgi:ribose transport system substrate-binding protein
VSIGLRGVIARSTELGRLVRGLGRGGAKSTRAPRRELGPFSSAPIAGLGPQGERAASLSDLELTQEEAARAEAAKFKVGVVMHTLESDYANQQVDGITATLRDYQAEVIEVVDCGFAIDRQIAALRQMVAMRPDAIVSIPVDDTATAHAHRLVGRAGIALVLMDNAPRGLQPERDYATVVSADNRANGLIAAQTLSPYVPQGGTVGLLGFDADFFATDERESAFKHWFTGNRPDVQVLQTDFHDPADAGAVAEKFLVSHPALDALFVVWDTPAMETVDVARRLGREVAIATVDLGEQAAVELAAGGLIKGLGAQQPYDQGVAEALAAVKALLGSTPPAWVAVPALRVTRENVLEAFERVWHVPPPDELIAAHAAGARSPDAAPRS